MVVVAITEFANVGLDSRTGGTCVVGDNFDVIGNGESTGECAGATVDILEVPVAGIVSQLTSAQYGLPKEIVWYNE
jgi:hypothetical protein